MSELATLRAQWEQWLPRQFPRDVGHLGGLDVADLAELDGFLAGFVSRSAEGRKLSREELFAFRSGLADLAEVLPRLAGAAHIYFAALAGLSEAAIRVQALLSGGSGDEG